MAWDEYNCHGQGFGNKVGYWWIGREVVKCNRVLLLRMPCRFLSGPVLCAEDGVRSTKHVPAVQSTTRKRVREWIPLLFQVGQLCFGKEQEDERDEVMYCTLTSGRGGAGKGRRKREWQGGKRQATKRKGIGSMDWTTSTNDRRTKKKDAKYLI